MADDRVTDAMVEAFCLSYWHGDWPYDKNEAERELCNELRANVRAGMSAALRAEAGAVGCTWTADGDEWDGESWARPAARSGVSPMAVPRTTT